MPVVGQQREDKGRVTWTQGQKHRDRREVVTESWKEGASPAVIWAQSQKVKLWRWRWAKEDTGAQPSDGRSLGVGSKRTAFRIQWKYPGSQREASDSTSPSLISLICKMMPVSQGHSTQEYTFDTLTFDVCLYVTRRTSDSMWHTGRASELEAAAPR